MRKYRGWLIQLHYGRKQRLIKLVDTIECFVQNLTSIGIQYLWIRSFVITVIQLASEIELAQHRIHYSCTWVSVITDTFYSRIGFTTIRLLHLEILQRYTVGIMSQLQYIREQVIDQESISPNHIFVSILSEQLCLLL